MTLQPDAEDLMAGDIFISDAAWARWISTIGIVKLMGASGAIATYGVFTRVMRARVAAASDADRAAMQWARADCLTVQAEAVQGETAGDAAAQAAAAAYNAQLSERAFLSSLPLGRLKAHDGSMHRFARLFAALGSHVTRASRDADLRVFVHASNRFARWS